MNGGDHNEAEHVGGGLRQPRLDSEALLEVIPDLVFRLDRGGRFLDLWANDDSRLYVPREAIVDRSLHATMPSDVADESLRHIALTLETGETQAYEYELPVPRGVEVFEARMVACGTDEVLCLVRDITERRRAEEVLRQRSAVIENSMDGMAVLDEDGGYVYINEAHTKLYGYDGPEELLGKGWAVFYDEEQIALFHRHAMPALRRDGHWRGEAVGRRRDGSTFPQELSISTLKGGGFVCVVHDAIERKLAEGVRSRLATIVESSDDAIISRTRDGVVTSWNKGAEKLYGYAAEEVEGRSSSFLYPPELHQEMEEILGKIQRGERTEHYETVRMTKGGRRVHVSVSVSPIRDASGYIVGDSGIARDITERKEAEEALKLSEERFRSLVQNASDVITVIAADGTIRYQSPSMRRILGHDPEGRIGKNLFRFSLIHPDDRAERRATFDRVMDSSGASASHEMRMRHRDGSWRDIEATITNLLDDPSVEGIVINSRDVTERKRVEETFRQSERRFRQLFEQSVDALLVHDEEGRIVDCNGEACRSLGYSREEMLSLSVKDFAANLASVEEQALKIVLHRQRVEAREIGTIAVGSHLAQHRRKDGTTFPVEVRVGYVDFGGKRRMLASARDITETTRAAEGLLRSERELAEAQRMAHVGSWSFEVSRNEARWSDEMYRIFGFTPQEFGVTYKKVLKLVHPDDRDKVRRATREVLRKGDEDPFSLDYRLVRPDGEVRFLHSEYEVVRDELGRPLRLVGTSQDVTERKALEKRLTHQALHDPLTGLPNRVLLMDRLDHALARARRDGSEVAVLFVDLDNFKVVNDSLGHDAGDRLLVEVAERLRVCLRPEDTAARLGGDEFAVLLEGVTHEGEAVRVANRIGEALRTPVSLRSQETHEAQANASIGIAMGAPGRLLAGDLLRNADIAMYQAKAKGKARYELFKPTMNARASKRLEAENRFRKAVERGEIVAHYQPQVSLEDGAIVGMEALARWEDPERGLVLPSEFITLAEETGLIVPMGDWVVREACRRAVAWREEHTGIPPVVVWVNLSPRQFHRTDMVGQVSSILEETGLDPHHLGLEITEGVVIDDAEATIKTLWCLKKLGMRLAIDDFGKGYSSLNYVKHFPVDYLKIDRSFVSGIRENPEDLAIAQAVITLGHALGMEVVAEGVETAGQLDLLRGLGCDQGQGYHFARPMPGEGAFTFLARRSPR